MDLSQLNISLETIVTVGAAVPLFLRIHTGIDGIRKEMKADHSATRTELKGDIEGLRQDLRTDIRRVEQKSEDAHKAINEKLAGILTVQAAQSERFNTVWGALQHG